MEKDNNQAKPKKGFLSKLTSLVYEDDGSTQSEETSTTSTAPVANSGAPSKFSYSDVAPTTNQQNIPSAMVIQNSNGMFDEKFYNSFLKIIEENNVEGIDYFEFSKALKALTNTGMQDPLKYQAAFGSLKANSNLTKDTLLKTADFYIEKLNTEETEFNNEMKHEIEVQVGNRLNQAKIKQDEIAKKQEQILQLQAEMGALQGEIGTLNMEAQQTQAKIEATAKNFKVSLEVLKGQITLDKQNINTYIQQ